jgi:hypothetical protein
MSESEILKKYKEGFLMMLDTIRKNSFIMLKEDLIPFVDKMFEFFGEFEKEIAPEMEEMKRKVYGHCNACGQSLGPEHHK